jgi:hypothetical protein
VLSSEVMLNDAFWINSLNEVSELTQTAGHLKGFFDFFINLFRNDLNRMKVSIHLEWGFIGNWIKFLKDLK